MSDSTRSRRAALRRLEADDADAWADALLALEGVHDAETDEAVLAFLRRLEPAEWWEHDDEAFLALAHLDARADEKVVEVAVEWAVGSRGDAQGLACEVLVRAGVRGVAPRLRARLGRRGPAHATLSAEGVEALARALAALEGPAAEPFFVTLVTSRDTDRRRAGLAGLRALERVTSLGPVRALVEAEPSSAVLTLLVHGAPEAWDLVEAMDDDDRELLLLRAQSVERLDLGTRLVAQLEAGRWGNCRVAAAAWLLSRGHRSASRLLAALAEDPREAPWVRVQATALQLEHGKGRRTLQRLIALVEGLEDAQMPDGELGSLLRRVCDLLDGRALDTWRSALAVVARGSSEVARAARIASTP